MHTVHEDCHATHSYMRPHRHDSNAVAYNVGHWHHVGWVLTLRVSMDQQPVDICACLTCKNGTFEGAGTILQLPGSYLEANV